MSTAEGLFYLVLFASIAVAIVSYAEHQTKKTKDKTLARFEEIAARMDEYIEKTQRD